MIKKTVLMLVFLTSSLVAEEKIYLDYDEVDCSSHDAFYIHQGENIWLKANSIFRDNCGTFTFESNMNKIGENAQMAQQYWKCPYCNRYWPKGEPCGNKDCPSRYL
jgi:hypothetical protein